MVTSSNKCTTGFRRKLKRPGCFSSDPEDTQEDNHESGPEWVRPELHAVLSRDGSLAAGRGCYDQRVVLPNGERAFIDPRKFADYSLFADHPVGGHKAVLFERILGITVADAELLRDILLLVAARAEAAIGQSDDFGRRYTIDFHLMTATGDATVRSAWIVRTAEDFPRLTTCFMLRD